MVGSAPNAPRLALGTVQWGQPYGIANRTGQPDLREVQAILTVAREAGITTLDTARAYGESESVIGRLVGDDCAWTVVTKLSPDVWSPGQPPDLAAAATRASLEASGRALRREKLPVLLHRACHRTAAQGKIWETLQKERDAGRVGVLGISAASPEEALAALEDPEVELIQVATSLLDQRLVRARFFERAAALHRQVFVRSVFLQGIAHLPPGQLPGYLAPLRGPLGLIRARAAELGLTPPELFLAFAKLLHNVTLLLGCETAEQLRNNLKAWRKEVSPRKVKDCAEAVPDLPASILDPSRWNTQDLPGPSGDGATGP